ncbi:GNAT family N-acetyltransferase [Kitasatospora mediocidica]|uniref:GNAT family N-acetyltransferase n=1 Tax=Kitasatospora mediocidica TaxID=58352 RepID=UPI000A072C61|nr:GNAT family protein [Kitasatospora mediocidica]
MRVTIREPRPADIGPYAEAVRRSAEHIGQWNPVEPDGLPELLQRQGEGLRTFLIIDRETGGLAGKCNVANIVMGRFCNGALGYDSYVPFNGTGRMTEGLQLVIDRCFADQASGGLGLHRLEINVQPDNERSVALARRLRFRHEGFTPRMLFLSGAWRDHERFALTREERTPLA